MGIESSKFSSEIGKKRNKTSNYSQKTIVDVNSLMEIEGTNNNLIKQISKNALEKRHNSSPQKNYIFKVTDHMQKDYDPNSDSHNEKELKKNKNKGEPSNKCKNTVNSHSNNEQAIFNKNEDKLSSKKESKESPNEDTIKKGRLIGELNIKGKSAKNEINFDSTKPSQDVSVTCFRIINNQNEQSAITQFNQNYEEKKEDIISHQGDSHQLPTATTTKVRIEWKEGGRNVFLAGSYNDWKITKMNFDELLNLHFCEIVSFELKYLNVYFFIFIYLYYYRKSHLESTFSSSLLTEGYFCPKIYPSWRTTEILQIKLA